MKRPDEDAPKNGMNPIPEKRRQPNGRENKETLSFADKKIVKKSKVKPKEAIIMLSLTIPDSVLHSLKLPEKTLPRDLMNLLAVKLYEKGALGIGKACELCGKSRMEFMQVLKEEDVFLNYDDVELDRDLDNMESFR